MKMNMRMITRMKMSLDESLLQRKGSDEGDL